MNVVKNFGQNFSNEVGSALHLKSSKDNQHPVAKGADGKKSNRISVDVDNAYKVFTEFQVNLKHLATLYKTEHELMKSLNENGLYTAKCHQKMLSNSPLQLIVTSPKDLIAEIAQDDTTDASPNKKKHLDPEGSPVQKAQSKEYEKGEFVTAGLSKSESVDVDNDEDQHESYLRNIEPEEVLEEQDYKFTKKRTESSFVANPPKQTVTEKKEDPPSKSSLLKKQEDFDDEEAGDQQVAHDHSDSEFPNDEKPGDDIENDNVQKEGLNVMVNVIDDSDDSFTDQVINDDDSFADDNGAAVQEAEAGVDGDNDADVTKDSHNGDETNEANERAPMDPDGEVLETTNGEKDHEQEPELNDKKGSDGATEAEEELDLCDVEIAENAENVEPSAPELNELNKILESPVVVDDEDGISYYQVHKQVYKETNSYLKKHSKLVDYVEDWEKTVTTRVQSMHSEYQKLRKGTLQTIILIITYFAQALTITLFIPGLNHYTFKVDSLQAEKRKPEEKNRDMPPKRLEKLERNRTKLMGTRKSHDAAGVDLIILIDEIVNRCWKDAFPLLHNSANFETEFSAMQAKVYSSLSSTLVMLDQVSKKESVLPSDNRLLSLASSSPEELNFYKFKGDWD